jgi:hypothetical protein
MLHDAVSNQWFWLGAAGFFIALLGVLIAYNRLRSTARAAKFDQDGWTATGRIDFMGVADAAPDKFGNFLLQAEDTRIVNSIGGVDHHEVRWRKATLNEAKKVVIAYHAHLKLQAVPELHLASEKDSDPQPSPPAGGQGE